MYGLAENIRDFRQGTNHTQTFYAVDAGNPVDGNAYGVIPFYQETRYGSKGTTSHGVYARNGMLYPESRLAPLTSLQHMVKNGCCALMQLHTALLVVASIFTSLVVKTMTELRAP